MKPTLCTVLLVSLVLVAASLTGCGDRGAKSPQTAKEYPIKGTVTAIGTDKNSVTIDHEDIPGLMEAMEMEFAVRDPNVVEGIYIGDAVEGRLQKSDELIITRLQKRTLSDSGREKK